MASNLLGKLYAMVTFRHQAPFANTELLEKR